MFEESTKLVSISEMFSKNETADEIPTEHLKFLLLPFFLAQTTLKLSSQDRANVLEVTKIYFEDFLTRCEEYGLGERTVTAVSKSVQIMDARDEIQRLTQMAQQRNNKVQKYQQKKELKEQIAKLKIDLEKGHVDDEIRRKFYIKLIKLCIWDAQDELSMMEQEVEIIKHMEMTKKYEDKSPKASKSKVTQPTQPLKPIIITRDNIQKAIYGAGYPSLPTYTVDEFYEHRVQCGDFPTAAQVKENANRPKLSEEEQQELDDVEKELKIENDDPDYLERTRKIDEYKDEHKRGSGNRHNRS
jgi:immunoglobulin-binding protein 1